MILGIGLASLFYKACTDKNCLVFSGPVLSEVDRKIYKHGEKCYKYTSETTRCDSNKRILDISKVDMAAAAGATGATGAGIA
jgi:hypothetical protein